MRDHQLSVMTLEEYEPNRQFVGRNFNAGEIIQLVLKSPGSGRWLPFEYVQMVMMHELAHCKQMNHSRAFWAVRNQYATHMYGLWAKGYKGDGIWGRGAKLGSGEWEKNTIRPDEALPEHLCGGTYRSRRRKRKAKPTLTYQERKDRRILKKFGKNGVALGADDEAKVKLEKGKKIQAKPRVAGSARGRELRAAAALARFEQKKTEETKVKDEEEDETESGSGSDYDDGDVSDQALKDAVDLDGSQLKDGQGRNMVRVCQDEDADDPEARNELDELRDVFRNGVADAGSTGDAVGQSSQRRIKLEPGEESMITAPEKANGPPILGSGQKEHSTTAESSSIRIKREPSDPTTSPAPEDHTPAPGADKQTCGLCSFANQPLAVTCGMCANVLDPTTTPRAWRCEGEACRESPYRNSGDCGVCGLCGERRG